MRPGWIYSFGSYFPITRRAHHDSSWSQIVLGVKRGDRWITQCAAKIIAAHLDCWLDLNQTYTVVYPPSCKQSDRYPAGILARGIHEHLSRVRVSPWRPLLHQDCVKRSSQHRCHTLSQREENVRGLFSVTGNIRDQLVLLVDDIITTGATMRECVSVLMTAGAAGVIGIAMAKTAARRRR